MRAALLVVVAACLPVVAGAPFLFSPQPRFRGFQGPALRHAVAPVASPLAEIRLGDLLDRNRKMVEVKLKSGCAPWHAGLGYDSAYRERFILLSCGKRLMARKLVEGDSLFRGILLEPEPGVVYRLKFHLRLPHLFTESYLSLESALDRSEPKTSLKLGDLLGRTAEAGTFFPAGDRELGVYYVTDIDPRTSSPAATRTILIVERRGLRSVAWPIPESSLPAGRPVDATLGALTLTLVRTTDGTLFVYHPAAVR